MKNKTVVVDTSICNIFNVQRALEEVGAQTLVTDNREQILKSDRLILPGVGAFAEGMKELYQKNLVDTIHDFARMGRPILGICLGMQLLMDYSEENGKTEGLKLMEGKVVRLRSSAQHSLNYKIPQMGWNTLKSPGEMGQKNIWGNTILAKIGDDPFVYFLHSYVVNLKDPSYCLAETNYGDDTFCSVFQRENIMGCQFHPERSGEVGLKIYRNFLAL